MKSTELILKALDIELKKLLSADIKRFREKQQTEQAANHTEVKKAA